MDCSPPGFSVHGDSPGTNTGVGCHSLLQGIFPNQGSNPGLPHCRQILHHLSHQDIHIYIWLIHLAAQQKLTQHYKVTIFWWFFLIAPRRGPQISHCQRGHGTIKFQNTTLDPATPSLSPHTSSWPVFGKQEGLLPGQMFTHGFLHKNSLPALNFTPTPPSALLN